MTGGGDAAQVHTGYEKSLAERDGNGLTAGMNNSNSNTGSTSKANGSTIGSMGGNVASNGGSSTQTQLPSRTHNWVPGTTTAHQDAVYKTVHHDTVTQERSICNSCGADITGNDSAHMKEYALKGDIGHSYSIVPVTIQSAYDEQVLV